MWIKVASETDFQRTTRVEVKDKEIALFKQEDGIYAIDDICSHEFSRLSEGMVWDGKVYCAKHGSAFDIKTGEVGSLPATDPVKTYETKVEEGEVYIKL